MSLSRSEFRCNPSSGEKCGPRVTDRQSEPKRSKSAPNPASHFCEALNRLRPQGRRGSGSNGTSRVGLWAGSNTSMIARLVDFKEFCPKSVRMKRSINLLEAASLGGLSSISLPPGPGVWPVSALLFASLAAFAISHFCYIRKIRPSQ